MQEPTGSVMTHSEMCSPSDYDWAYLAGLFDGEGCIKVVWQRLHRTTRKGITWGISLDICNTYRPVLEWVMTKFGGKVYSEERKNPNQRRKFHWYVMDSIAIRTLLTGMQPYLHIKKRQARIAKVALVKRPIRDNRGIPLSAEELSIRERAAKLLKWDRHREWAAFAVVPLPIVNCPRCGTAIVPKNKNHQYCSARCRGAYLAAAARAKHKKLYNILCKRCGQPVETSISYKIFCSARCRNAYFMHHHYWKYHNRMIAEARIRRQKRVR